MEEYISDSKFKMMRGDIELEVFIVKNKEDIDRTKLKEKLLGSQVLIDGVVKFVVGVESYAVPFIYKDTPIGIAIKTGIHCNTDK